uniref:Uncharacterized protein n=1 Tax=Globisporangium ultimum (strain ATCC 200006 / CBS 805.95 / DAOM BR144) TaxID=431595 RepID=K3WX99_GLOUD
MRNEQQVAAAPLKPTTVVAATPIATPVEQGAIVQANPAATSTAIEVGGQQQGGLGNMGTMLMNLLARTTETQQQLAAQQGVMFETLGQHSTQLDSLNSSMNSLEQKFEQVRLKRAAAKAANK